MAGVRRGVAQMTALDVLWVGLGGSLGLLMRWWVGRVVGERYRGNFPLGMLLIKISGAFPMTGTPATGRPHCSLPDRYHWRLHDLQQHADGRRQVGRNQRPCSCRVLSRTVGRGRSAGRRARGRACPRAGLRRSGVVNFVILVMVGGGLGAMLREFVMLMVSNPVDGFPLDILVANLLAAFLLGLVTALRRCQTLSDDVNMLLGAGIMGQ